MSVVAPRPWYSHSYLWLVILLPLAAVSLSISFVYVAFTHQDPVVRDDWYQDGKAVNQSLDRSDKAIAMGLLANVRVDASTGQVFLNLRSREPIAEPALDLNFVHATLSDHDQHIKLERVMGNDYSGHLIRPLVGTFQIELATPAWRISGLRRLPDGEGFTLQAQ